MSSMQAIPTRSIDTTAERHFAEILKEHMVDELKYVEAEFNTKVKAIITDAASDCRKARSLLVEEYPHVVSLDCFAHQVHNDILHLCSHAVHVVMQLTHAESQVACFIESDVL